MWYIKNLQSADHRIRSWWHHQAQDGLWPLAPVFVWSYTKLFFEGSLKVVLAWKHKKVLIVLIGLFVNWSRRRPFSSLHRRRKWLLQSHNRDTKLSIEEIALDCRVWESKIFFRQFKKRYGMTPHKYRKENIKDKKR